MLEVLVAIVVLSFGLLGMVGLQSASLQVNREARLQATAVRLAAELAERMRGNQAVAVQTTATANPYLQADFRTDLPETTANCLTQSCISTLDVAKWDMKDWLGRVKAELPNPRVVVCFDATPFDADGVPQWSCSGSGGVVNVKIGWTRSATNRSLSGNAGLERAGDGGHPAVVLPVSAGNTQ